jgi:hypothetical protein
MILGDMAGAVADSPGGNAAGWELHTVSKTAGAKAEYLGHRPERRQVSLRFSHGLAGRRRITARPRVIFRVKSGLPPWLEAAV